MRVLVATTAGVGHFAGLLPFARACAGAKHEVLVAAPGSFAPTVERTGLEFAPLSDAEPAALGAVFGRLPALPRSTADEVVVQEVFGRLDRDAALPGIRDLVERWQPDVVLREPAELASYVVAEERGIPHVQANIGLGILDDRLVPLLEAPLAEVGAGTDGLRTARRWTVVPPSFDRPAAVAHGEVTAFRDAAPAPDDDGGLPPWWPGDEDRPLVYVTFGSVAAGMGMFPVFYARVLEQLAALPARVLMTTGEAGDPADLGVPPANVHVERWWPQEEVMPHASVVVGHGGFGTTHAALVAGVPQVVLPLFSFDQFLNARRTAEVGIGTALLDEDADDRLAGGTVPAGPQATDRLAEAVLQLLDDASFSEAARRLADEVEALPPVEDCVGALLPR